MTELLPCPFCGDRHHAHERGGDGWPVIRCLTCGALGPCHEPDEDGAAKLWNTRVLSTHNNVSSESSE